MPTHAYSTVAGRINEIKGATLKHAVPVEVLALGCKMEKMPKNEGDNVTYRRWLPFGATSTTVHTQNRPAVTASAHITAEGVTPAADLLTPVDVNVQLQQYACLYSYTDKAAELYEDDIPQEMKIQTGERMGLVREMIRYGSLKAASNVLYAGGTSRATVDETVGLNVIRKMAQTLFLNHAKMKTKALKASPDYETFAVSAGFVVFCSTDMEPDIRNLPGFTPVERYGTRSVLSEFELGSCERYRFITSPELTAYADSGAAVGATGLFSTTGANIDVYPLIVMGEEAAFDVALRGMNSFSVIHIPHNREDKSDPLGQRGYVGAKFYSAVLVANGGWMGVIECGRTAL